MNLENEILIVDDAPENLEFVQLILSEDSYRFTTASNGNEALQKIRSGHFDLILLDVMMPGLDGFEVCKILKQSEVLKDIPVIFLTVMMDEDSITRAFSLGAEDYITKPFNAAELLARVKHHIELHNTKKRLSFLNNALQQKLELKERRLISEIEESQKEMIYALTEMIEVTSDETGKHIRRVAEYSRLLAHFHPNLTLEDEEIISLAAPMHDIGKVLIPAGILDKPGKLTANEYDVMKTHTTKAHDFLGNSSRRLIKAADIIAAQHHEKWDGSGYPYGLYRDEIHLYGRIVALADVFDALTNKRQYKEAWDIEEAIRYVQDRSAKQFDPQLVELFTDNIEDFIQIFKNET